MLQATNKKEKPTKAKPKAQQQPAQQPEQPTTTATVQQPKQEVSTMQMAQMILPYFPFPLLVLAFLAWRFNIFSAFRRGKKQADTEKGSAHFAERNEIKELLKPMTRPAAGEILIGKWNERSFFRLKNKFVVLPRELALRHILVSAPNGAGKSRTVFLPNLAIGGEQSFLCTDPKSELWELTSGKQINPIRFAPMESKTAAFNWIPLCKDVRTAKRCAEAIIHANEGKPDHFWTPGEQDLLTALFVHTAHTEQPTPAHVYEILTSGAEKLSNILINSASDVARRTGTGFIESDTKVQTGFIQGLKTKLNWLDDPAIRRFTSSTTIPFHFGSLRQKPAQVYWCLRQSDVTELTPLTALFFNLATLQLLDADGEVPMTFFYDEFANVGKLNNFHKDITLLRGQKVAVVAGLQSRSQLNSIYGKDNANTILENFNNKILLAGLQMETAEDFSKMLGEFTYTDIRTSTGSSSSSKGWFNGSTSTNQSYYTSARRLMTADELRRLKKNQCILYSTNLPPLFLETVFYKEGKNEAQISEIGMEIDIPSYNDATAPKQINGKPVSKNNNSNSGKNTDQKRAAPKPSDFINTMKVQPAQPPAEQDFNFQEMEDTGAADYEEPTIVRSPSGKLIRQVVELAEPEFTTEDLHSELHTSLTANELHAQLEKEMNGER